VQTRPKRNSKNHLMRTDKIKEKQKKGSQNIKTVKLAFDNQGAAIV
jgi:hypothetical protein